MERDEQTGQYVQLADRWHVNFCDLSGRQGMLGQVEGRTVDDAAYWLLQAPPAWRDRVEVVAIDMCTVFLAAVRRALPQAQVAVDLFHVVQLAVKAVGDVRRRATREKYGRRGKEGDPEYGIKGLLNRNLESLSPAQFARVIQTLDADGHGQQIALAWIAKEKLWAALNLRARFSRSQPCERQVRDRLFAFCDWCAAHEAIPELITLATTISRWEDKIVTAVLTGVTNATSESLNHLAKLEARLAYGFRNPASQRRRVWTACTRGTRRRLPTATSTTKRSVISRQQVPGYSNFKDPRNPSELRAGMIDMGAMHGNVPTDLEHRVGRESVIAHASESLLRFVTAAPASCAETKAGGPVCSGIQEVPLAAEDPSQRC